MDLTSFKTLINEKCGLFFDNIRIQTLADGVNTRMSKKGIASYAGYLDFLLHDQEEFHRLVSLLTIKETYFFREPQHLKILVDRVIFDLLCTQKSECKIGIVSAGCATGEEPYSLAIAIMEKYGTAMQGLISIKGFDIDSDAIERARKGMFFAHSFREFPIHLKEKYFETTKNNDIYRIKDFVKEGVEFLTLNLLSDKYPDMLKGVDIIFYRNVSIYLSPETQINIFKKLAGLLKEKGYLFLSSTETLSHNVGILALTKLDDVFLYRKNSQLSLNMRRNAV